MIPKHQKKKKRNTQMRINIRAINEGLHFKGSGRCSIIHFSFNFSYVYLLLLLCWLKHLMVFLFFAPHQIMEKRETERIKRISFFVYLFICGFFLLLLFCMLIIFIHTIFLYCFVKINWKVYHYLEYVMLCHFCDVVFLLLSFCYCFCYHSIICYCCCCFVLMVCHF